MLSQLHQILFYRFESRSTCLDCQMHMRNIKQRLIPVATWRAGERVKICEPWGMWPNVSESYQCYQSRERNLLHVTPD